MCGMHMRMNRTWSALNFDWNQVRAFLATAEQGSLSGAARVLGTTQPTVGRQVTALEEALGVALFERVGRGLELTPSGADVLAEVQAMGAAAERVSLVAAGRNDDPTGKVAISVSDLWALHVMPGVLRRISERAPGLEIELIVTNDFSDLLRREADIAIRHQCPKDDELIARRLPDGKGGFYASKTFIQRHGHPRNVSELKDLPIIGMGPPEDMARELGKLGFPIKPEAIKLYSGAIFAAWEMARAGLGIGMTSEDVASQDPNMVRVLQDEPFVPIETWLVTHRELRTARRIRLVWDMLVEAVGGETRT